MNEHDWLTSDDPGGMLECLQGSASERKRRLFACLCCRGIWEMLDEWGRPAVEVSERWADGEASEEELAECQQFAEAQMAAVAGGEFSDEWLVAVVSAALAGDAAGAAHLAENLEAWGAYQGSPGPPDSEAAHFAAEQLRHQQAGRLRELFGNPFRAVTINPAWRTSTVRALAAGIYAERAFDRMPILADALQDAECDNDDILTHCRSHDPHVRGCWVVDLVLGRQ